MRTFTVCGNREVAGVKPGGQVSEKDLGHADVDALIGAGHIALRVTSKKSAEAEEPNEEQ